MRVGGGGWLEGEEEEEAEIFKPPKKMFSFFSLREYIARLAYFAAASTDNISDFL